MATDPSASVDVPIDTDLDDRRAVSFTVARRGYDQQQVDLVLADMAAQVTKLRTQLAELREREADLLVVLDDAEYRARTAESTAQDLRDAADRASAEAAAAEAADQTPAPLEPAPEAALLEPAEAPDPSATAAAGAPELRADLAAPADDVATMVGEETIRIVEAARHAALEIGARARDDAERVAAEAREEARLIRADAEVQLLHKTREADDAIAARLLEAADAVQDAQTRADAIVADAFTEAATVVLRAREEAAAVVAEGEARSQALTDAATATRDDLLVDLLRRRKVLRRQVEQLEAGRVRLRAAYTVVEGALTEATDELDRTVAEARDAAGAAAAQADATDDPELREAAAALGADPDVLIARVDPEPEPEPAATAVADPNDAVEPPVTADADTDADAAVVSDGPPSDREDAATDPSVDPAVDGWTGPDATAPADVAADEPEAEIDLRGDTDDPADDTEPAPARRRRRAPDPVEFEGRWSSAVRVLPPGPETPDVEPGTKSAAGRPGRSRSASDLFARLRAGESHQPSLFEPAEPGAAAPARADATTAASAEPVPVVETDGTEDPEEAWIERRDAAFAPALRALRRRLKATLADDEDSLLEAVQRVRTVPATIDSLRDARARRDDLAVALVASLATAAAAGAELARSASEADESAAVPVDGDAVADLALDQVAVELSDAVVDPLDERLDRCVAKYHRSLAEPDDAAEAGDAAMASLVSSIKAAYRARRGAQVQVPTEHAVLLAGHRGLVAALEPGTPLRWVVAAPAASSRRAPSTETDADPAGVVRACASCVAVADVGAGDPFGHGHLLPPARPGCRCAVAPVSAAVPRRA